MTFQLTRSVGSVTEFSVINQSIIVISTHTLRGERDHVVYSRIFCRFHFNSHAPWGAWLFSFSCIPSFAYCISTHTLRGERDSNSDTLGTAPCSISTHTLRGERDQNEFRIHTEIMHFNSHAPWGAWLYILYMWSHTTTTERTFY